MKPQLFDDMFPNAPIDVDYEVPNVDVVFKWDKFVPCVICGRPTRWRSVGLEGTPVCSSDCIEEWWASYKRALLKEMHAVHPKDVG